jgi:hypothetical protein
MLPPAAVFEHDLQHGRRTIPLAHAHRPDPLARRSLQLLRGTRPEQPPANVETHELARREGEVADASYALRRARVIVERVGMTAADQPSGRIVTPASTVSPKMFSTLRKRPRSPRSIRSHSPTAERVRRTH